MKFKCMWCWAFSLCDWREAFANCWVAKLLNISIESCLIDASRQVVMQFMFMFDNFPQMSFEWHACEWLRMSDVHQKQVYAWNLDVIRVFVWPEFLFCIAFYLNLWYANDAPKRTQLMPAPVDPLSLLLQTNGTTHCCYLLCALCTQHASNSLCLCVKCLKGDK